MGCTLPPKPLDSEGSLQSVNTDLVCDEQIHIQPISINGAMPPKASFVYSMQTLEKYTTNNIVIYETINLTLAKDEASPFILHFADHGKAYDLSPEDTQAFESSINKSPRSRNSIVMFFTPELHWPTGRRRNSTKRLCLS